MRPHYTLTTGDVGRAWIKAFGRSWMACDFIGRVLPGDVGKRVYLTPTNDGEHAILQVENDEQRANREQAIAPGSALAAFPKAAGMIDRAIAEGGAS
jgi:hypothetical protein